MPENPEQKIGLLVLSFNLDSAVFFLRIENSWLKSFFLIHFDQTRTFYFLQGDVYISPRDRKKRLFKL